MSITALSDAELIEQARGGDEAAFTELYVRHQPAALRLARTYRRLGDPDELVNGAFERVLGAIKRGAGPTESFRAYLFVTLRRYATEKAGKPEEESLDDVPEPVSDAADSPALAQADRDLISHAFESLPERWQAVLWHTAVEGRQPRELAEVMGVSANAAAAMSYRAREKLRQAYLQAHLLASPAPDHEPYRSELGAYVRGGLSARDMAALDRHLEGCDSCRALVAELEDVNRTLARAVLPLFLLVGGGKLGGALAGGATVAGAAPDKGGATGLLGKIKHAAPAVGNTAAIAVVVAGVVGMASIVARQDSGPLNSAADAADLDASDGEGPPGDRDRDAGDDGDSLFGDSDFAVSPFGDSDFVVSPFGDTVDFDSRFGDDRRGVSRGSGSSVLPASRGGSNGGTVPRPPVAVPAPPQPVPTTPPPAGPEPTPPPPAGPGPITPPPDPEPTDPGPATPPPLTFTSATWTPTAPGQGTLAVTVAERDAPAGPGAPVGSTETPPAELRADLVLTPGARPFPGAALAQRCSPPPAPAPGEGPTISCTLEQPPTGGNTTFTFELQVDGPGQTANMVLFRGAGEEARFAAPVDLAAFESGLSVRYGTGPWTPDGPGTGTLVVTVAQSGAWAVSGASIVIDLTGEVRLDPQRPTPGCTQEATGNTGITCVLPTIPAGGSADLVLPLAVTGDGQQVRSLTLMVGGAAVTGLDEPVELRQGDGDMVGPA